MAYGKFLAERYKDEPNIIWMIGGDIRGDNKTEVWDALANSIRSIDKGHLMTFHPRGRTTSATWFNDREWLDFNMFQSGHRRYGQRNGDGDYPIEENTEEDNWRFVEASQAKTPLKPVIDDEPIYEDIPQGLHDPNETRWNQHDVRRYAYWSVFAGSFGHSYGHNDIMQVYPSGIWSLFWCRRTQESMVGCFGRSRLQSDEISEELDVRLFLSLNVCPIRVLLRELTANAMTVPSLPVEMTICWFTITQDVLCRSI